MTAVTVLLSLVVFFLSMKGLWWVAPIFLLIFGVVYVALAAKFFGEKGFIIAALNYIWKFVGALAFGYIAYFIVKELIR